MKLITIFLALMATSVWGVAIPQPEPEPVPAPVPEDAAPIDAPLSPKNGALVPAKGVKLAVFNPATSTIAWAIVHRAPGLGLRRLLLPM
ncbi:hypothetical protein FQN50_001356 [Emmonsiellopsis sp. PD_5]|nr:hypothetical protein FQN50_001356 [Emmonsiellopsis sp. PD_5]